MIELKPVLIMGVLSTIAIDLYTLVLRHGFKQSTTDWAMVGRWFGHMSKGVFSHSPIGKSAAVQNELIIGWSAHFIIGIVYAWLYLFFMTYVMSTQPTLLSALLFGIATVLAPWLILQPGLGLGFFASKTPDPWRKRFLSLSVHAVFGLTLYLSWRLYNALV